MKSSTFEPEALESSERNLNYLINVSVKSERGWVHPLLLKAMDSVVNVLYLPFEKLILKL